ncbi:MAG: RDD family protein [Chloroflexota bacterium]
MSEASAVASGTDEPCALCGRPLGKGRFCLNCGVLRTDAEGTVVRAPRLARLGAFVIDLALIAVTLVVGWLIWYSVTAREGQSPGKRMLGLRVINRDGTLAQPGKMWLRLGLTVLLSGWLDPAFALLNRDAKTLHDLICRTLVVNAAGSEKLLRGTAASAAQEHTPIEESVPFETPAPEPEAAESAEPEVPSKPSFDPDAATLHRLAYLHDQKLITDEEYEDRRQRILDRL